MEFTSQEYREMSDRSDSYFEERIQDASKRAYEYGVLVVKNAFLVSGGGLFITPAIVQLAKEPDLEKAALAGGLFAGAVLFALFANYFIHINWMLHEQVWRHYRTKDQIDIRKLAKRAFNDDPEDQKTLEVKISKNIKWINRTFYIPHIFAFSFVVVFIFACFSLYQALGIGI
ncbi:MAG: hypothetical protein L3J30_05535 [Marinosulfonomonas sp.]|nr:hypothetical protein [Marinosulfonomonas sp.]